MDGQHAPGKCLNPLKCHFALPTEGLVCGHTILVAHAQAVYIYRNEYAPLQTGKISLVNVGQWFYPLDPYNPKDIQATQKALDLSLGWFVDPLFTGDYNPTMKQVYGKFLPKFTREQQLILKGSLDYFGLNHYTSAYVTHPSRKLDQSNNHNVIQPPLLGFKLTYSRNNSLIGSPSQTLWLFDVPKGFEDILRYIDDRYSSPDIYVMENGFARRGEAFMALRYMVRDLGRVEYYRGYIEAMLRAIESGVKVKGYISWTLTDK
jgi:beta-glucosidase